METKDYAEYTEIARNIIFSEDGLRKLVYIVDDIGKLAEALALIRLNAVALSFDAVHHNWSDARITGVGRDVIDHGIEFIEFTFRPGGWRMFVKPCRSCVDIKDFKAERAEIMTRLCSLYAGKEQRRRIMASRAIGAARRYLWEHAKFSDDTVDALTDLETKNYIANTGGSNEYVMLMGGWSINYVYIHRTPDDHLIIYAEFSGRSWPDRFGITMTSTGRRDERWRRVRDRIERRLLAMRAAETL